MYKLILFMLGNKWHAAYHRSWLLLRHVGCVRLVDCQNGSHGGIFPTGKFSGGHTKKPARL